MNQWYFVNGNLSSPNITGDFSKTGSGYPGSRYSASMITLSNDSLIIFGGFSYTDTYQGTLDDLWSFDPNMNKWYFLNGHVLVDYAANYSTLGEGYPGGRQYSGLVVLPNDSLILFGGYSQQAFYLNDIWRYDLLANQWFFMNGNQTKNAGGDYSTSGNGYPGSRYGLSLIKLLNDSLILFGGYNGLYLNDVWRYDLETNEWYFVNGNQTTNSGGFYSRLGNGYPGARFTHSMSLLSNNSIFLFAGYGYSSTSQGVLNDLWRYDPLSNDWYFLEGSTTTLSVPNFISSSGNGYPGSRYTQSISTLSNNSIIIFGGEGFNGILNELWIYNTDCPCRYGYCDPSNKTNCICDSGYFGYICEYNCTCVNGACDEDATECSSCDPNYFGPNCNECSCVTGICDDGINGTGICVTQSSINSSENPSSSSSENPSSSSSENPSSSSSGNAPTSKTTTTSSKSSTTTEHINTEASNISKLLPTILIFIFFFN